MQDGEVAGRLLADFPDVGADAVGVMARIRDEGVAFGVHQQFLGQQLRSAPCQSTSDGRPAGWISDQEIRDSP